MVKMGFDQKLKEVAESMAAGVSEKSSVRAVKSEGAAVALDREILEAVLCFAAEHAPIPISPKSKERKSKLTGGPFWQGQVSGFSIAEKLRERGGDLRDFFKHYAEIKSSLWNHLSYSEINPEEFRQGLVDLDKFFSGMAAGLVQEWLRSAKTAFRRRQQEAKLHFLLEKKRYATVFHNMSEPAFVVDHDLRIIDVNSSFEKFFNLPKAEAIGLSCCELIGRDICDGCPLEEILENGGSFSNVEISTPLLSATGTIYEGAKSLLIAGSALGDDRQGNQGGIVILQDITDRKKTEQELEKYRNWLEDLVDARTEELLEANENLKREIAERRHVENELIKATASLKSSNAELDHFAHVVSHDLQEPLMLIASFSERLLARYSSFLDERGREYLVRIKKGTGKLQGLVDALLQMSRVVTSATRFEILDMNDLVRDVLDDLEEIINRVGATIEIDKLHSISGDPVQIRQLFQNLISNALKYRKENQKPLIMIRSRLFDDLCEFTVEDNGIGFDEDDIERIFEPFVRLHSRDAYNGTGMGLTTCKKIVSRHDGEIKARSKPESGATFIVRLPVHH